MNICGGPNGISVFNNDHSLGTFTMKRAYWQPRGMPLFTHSDGEHVMQPVKESWENFDPKEFEETVCAGGANGVSSHAPEHMLGNGVQTFGRGIDSDKPDEENLADKPPVNTVAETWANYMPESVLNEQDQNPTPQQPVANAQPASQQPVAQPQATQPQQTTAPAQPAPQAAAQPQVQAQQPQQPAAQPQATPQQPQQVQQPQQINTQPQATAPQSQIVNNPQTQPVQESWEGFSMDSLEEAHYDPADYWDEDDNWCYAPRGAKVMDCDAELMAAERNRRKNHYGNNYSKRPKVTSNYKAKDSNPDNKFGSSKKFWAEAKNGVANFEAFHNAYDAELKDEITMSEIFNDEGKLLSKGVYGKIKTFCEKKPDSWAGKALKKLWALQFTDAGKPKEEPKEEPKVEKMEDKISHIIRKYEGHYDQWIKDLNDIGVEVIPEGFEYNSETHEINPNCIWKSVGSNGTVDEEDQAAVKALPYGNYVKSVYISDDDRNQCLFYIFEKDGKYKVLPGQWELWLD